MPALRIRNEFGDMGSGDETKLLGLPDLLEWTGPGAALFLRKCLLREVRARGVRAEQGEVAGSARRAWRRAWRRRGARHVKAPVALVERKAEPGAGAGGCAGRALAAQRLRGASVGCVRRAVQWGGATSPSKHFLRDGAPLRWSSSIWKRTLRMRVCPQVG